MTAAAVAGRICARYVRRSHRAHRALFRVRHEVYRLDMGCPPTTTQRERSTDRGHPGGSHPLDSFPAVYSSTDSLYKHPLPPDLAWCATLQTHGTTNPLSRL